MTTATTTRGASASSGLALASRTRRHCRLIIWRRCCCARRASPEFDRQCLAASAVDYSDAAAINTACVDQVVNRTLRALIRFTIARAEDYIVALQARCLLQLDCEVIESSLLIVELEIVVLVKLRTHRRFHRRKNVEGARPSVIALRRQTTDVNSRGDGLTRGCGRINRDRRRALTTRDRSG